MKRLAAGLAAAAMLSAAAAAMPSDLPWNVYACDAGKGVNLKFLSDGMAIGVLFGKDESKEEMVTTAPVDAEKQAGFQPGVYKALAGDFTLTQKADETVAITGKDVPNGPFEACKATGGTFGGDGG